MGDFETGTEIWSDKDCSGYNDEKEIQARIPKEILESSAVSRDVVFSSQEVIKNFHLIQRVFLAQQMVEFFEYKFGFVIPGSTNSWQQVISTDKNNMMAPQDISGKLVVETLFLDDTQVICTSQVRIYYV